MKVTIPEELEKEYPNISITKPKEECVRIQSNSHPNLVLESIKQVADKIIASNSHLDHSEPIQGINSHGTIEVNIVFKEKHSQAWRSQHGR